MEFKEYTNPESMDYDIKSSFSSNEEQSKSNEYIEKQNMICEELTDLIGILEDEEFDNIEKLYGITQQEYLNPTKETIIRVEEYLGMKQRKHR